MRKITQLAVKKFLNHDNFRMGNTDVWSGYECSLTRITRLSLHGNDIATKVYDTIKIDNQGWFSNTTKERLNGLLHSLGRIGIQQKNYKWYLDGKEWNGEEVELLKNNEWEYTHP